MATWPKKNLVHVVEFYLHVSDTIGSDSTKQKWQFRHPTATSVITAPPGRQMESPERVQPDFCGCKVSKCKAHCRYKSGEGNQLLHPVSHTMCASSSGHTCTAWLYPNKGALVCSLFTTAVISALVKTDFGENGEFTQRFIFSPCLVFSELCPSLLQDGESPYGPAVIICLP